MQEQKRSSLGTNATSDLARVVDSSNQFAFDLYSKLWESDLKDWLNAWRANGSLEIKGLKPGRRVPKLNESHMLLWKL